MATNSLGNRISFIRTIGHFSAALQGHRHRPARGHLGTAPPAWQESQEKELPQSSPGYCWILGDLAKNPRRTPPLPRNRPVTQSPSACPPGTGGCGRPHPSPPPPAHPQVPAGTAAPRTRVPNGAFSRLRGPCLQPACLPRALVNTGILMILPFDMQTERSLRLSPHILRAVN